MAKRRRKCEDSLGAEVMEKVRKNREFVETYEGAEKFDDDLIEVIYTKQKGFHVVAKQDIPKGTLIMEEKAQFYAPLKYDNHFAGTNRLIYCS